MPGERYAPAAMQSGAVQRRLPASLREPGPFRLLFWGQALSVVGDRITPVAIAFAVLGLGSATDLGLVLAAGGIPFALFALAGGVWADRVGRRGSWSPRTSSARPSQTVTALLLLTGTAEVWMLAVLAFVYGTAAAVFMPALIGSDPADGESGAPAGGQRAAGSHAQHRERGRPGTGRRAHGGGRLRRGDRRRRGDLRGQRAVPGADAAERRAGRRPARRSPSASSPGCAAGGTRCARARG